MNLRDLKYVVALADTGHFRKAAETVFVSQSTLSIQIKQLEEELGLLLFDRSLSPIQPTSKGLPIVELARRIVAQSEQMLQWAKGALDPMTATVRLAIIPTLAPYYLPHAMQILQHHHPKLKVLLFELQTHDMVARLHQGSLDAGVLALPLEFDHHFHTQPLFSEPFVLTHPAHAPLPQVSTERKATKPSKTPVSYSAERMAQWFADETPLPMLLLEEGHCLRGQALAACHLLDPASELVRATSLETLRQMVAQGLGYTLMPYLSTTTAPDPRVANLTLTPKVERHIGLVYRQKSPLAETLAAIGEVWQKHLPKGVSPLGG